MRPTLIAAATSFALLLAPPVCRGDVEVINHHFGSGGSYTVPDGMVLLLESGVNNSVGTGDLEIQIPGASFNFTYNTNTNVPSGGPVRQPLYLKEKTVIRAPSGSRRFIIFGRLVTPDELYANTGPSAEIEVSGGAASVVAKADSPRPVRFRFEESPDLLKWMKAAVSGLSTTRNSALAELEAEPGERSRFVRAVAREIPVGSAR